MTDKIALFLLLVILGCLAVDYTYYDWQVSTFLLRKLLAFIEFIAFWR